MWEDAALRLFGRVDTPERAQDAARWMAIAAALSGVYLITAGGAIRGVLWLGLAAGYWVWKNPVLAWAMLAMALLQLALSVRATLEGAVDYVGIGVSLLFIAFAGRAVQVARAWKVLEESA